MGKTKAFVTPTSKRVRYHSSKERHWYSLTKALVKNGARMFNASLKAELLSAAAEDLLADGTAPRYRF